MEEKGSLADIPLAAERAKAPKPRSASAMGLSVYENFEATGAVLGAGAQIGSNYANCTFVLGAQEEEESVSAVPLAERLRKSLQETYQSYTHLERLFDEGNTSIAKSFINLALVKEAESKSNIKALGRGAGEAKHDGGGHDGGEDDGREKGKSPLYVDERLASHEQLYAVKEPLLLTELFEPKDDTPTPNKVLVLGRAGIGKSILCQYLATQWASNEKGDMPVATCLQQKFEAVFWIKLREIAASVADAKEPLTLVEMLDRFCLSGLEGDRPTKKELTRYLKQSSDKVLFILDGYDEITEARHLDRVLEELSNHTHLLLTSRPIVIEKLGNRRVTFDRRLENMGFLNENIEAYIHQFMIDANQPEQAPLMLNFLKSHVGVWGIAHIPINLELLSWLWVGGGGDPIFQEGRAVTLSKLYQKIVGRVREEYERKAGAPESKGVGEIPNHVNTFLEYSAFHAMEKETLFIPGTDIRAALIATLPEQQYSNAHRAQLLKSATDKLGFLRTTGQGGRSQLDQEHYFIHLSFQEFYAARYITRVLSDHPHGQEAKHIFQCILTEKYMPRYQLMLWMSAGLLYQTGKKHRQFSALLYFWRAILSQPRDMIGFHHMVLVMHCLDECEADETVALHKALLKQQSEWELSSEYLEQLMQCPVLYTSKPMRDPLFQVWRENNYYLPDEILRRLSNAKETMIEILLEDLQNEYLKTSVRCCAIRKLSNVGHIDEAVLLSILQNENEDKAVRDQVFLTLRSLKNPSARAKQALKNAMVGRSEFMAGLRWLWSAITDPENIMKIPDHIREVAHDPDARRELLIALHSKDKDTRITAMKDMQLTRLVPHYKPDSAVTNALVNALQDQDRDIKKEAVSVLANSGCLSGNENIEKEIIEDFLNDLQNDLQREDRQDYEALRTLVKLGDSNASVRGILVSILQHQDITLRQKAAFVLCRLNNSSEHIVQALTCAQDKEIEVRVVILCSLGQSNHMNNALMASLLMSSLHFQIPEGEDEDGKAWSRMVMKGLSKLKNPDDTVIKTFISAMQDEDWDIRRAAVAGLGRLKNPNEDVINILISNLEGEEIREEVIQALWDIKNEHHAKMVFECLITTGACASAIPFLFDKNHLLCINHLKNLLVIRFKSQTYCVSLSSDSLLFLEKQIIQEAKSRAFPLDSHSLSGYGGLPEIEEKTQAADLVIAVGAQIGIDVQGGNVTFDVSANRATVTHQGQIVGTYRLQALQGNGAGREAAQEVNEQLIADGTSVGGQASQIGSDVQGLAAGSVRSNVNASGAEATSGGCIGEHYNFS